MSLYALRVTIACPSSLRDDANALGVVLGETAADAHTFGPASWQDEDGALYAVASTLARDTFPGRAQTTLEAPGHSPDADLVAAARAQATLVIGTAESPAQAAPSRLTAWLGSATDRALDHVAALGLTRVPEELE